MADHHGDLTEAMRAWLVETGRAEIADLELRIRTPTGHRTSEVLIG
ncbi:hypothetical protein [Kitasatospora sp. NPDC058218]